MNLRKDLPTSAIAALVEAVEIASASPTLRIEATRSAGELLYSDDIYRASDLLKRVFNYSHWRAHPF
jgi:hypothetical protein